MEPFFSGGAVAALPDGRALTACGDEVKVWRMSWNEGKALTPKTSWASQWTLFLTFSFSLTSNLTQSSDHQCQYGSCRMHACRGE